MSQHGGQDAVSREEDRDLREIPAIPEHQSGATFPTSSRKQLFRLQSPYT